jgi:hypothetical protein
MLTLFQFCILGILSYLAFFHIAINMKLLQAVRLMIEEKYLIAVIYNIMDFLE